MENRLKKSRCVQIVDNDNSSIVYERYQNKFLKRYIGGNYGVCEVCNTPHHDGIPSCRCEYYRRGKDDVSHHQTETEEQVLKAMAGKTCYFS
jgi:hypothetical protein